MVGFVAALIVFLSALPDDAATPPPPRGQGVVSMQAPSPVAAVMRAVVASVAPSDVEQPPGDARELGAQLPTILRLSLPARLAVAVTDPPPPVGSALPERPPKSV